MSTTCQGSPDPSTTSSSTHSYLTELDLPGAGTFALITIANKEPQKPATFSPDSLRSLRKLLEEVRERAAVGDFAGVGITGNGRTFVAGADLQAMRKIKDPESARDMAKLGHEAFGTIEAMGVPTFAFINGAAIGGGLEVALAADYRTISAGVTGISLPEAALGLVPGWGGVHRLPRLIGPGNSVKIMVDNALSNSKTIDGAAAFDLGIADAIFEHEPFLTQSLAWAALLIQADPAESELVAKRRAEKAAYKDADWNAAVAAGRALVESMTGNVTPAPRKLLDLLQDEQGLSREESANRQVDALTDLLQTPEFKHSVYALLDLKQRRSKNPASAPNLAAARPIRKVGVVGAGLMACQLALLFAKQLQVPVVLNDVDQTRVNNGVNRVHTKVDALVAKQRLAPEDGTRIKNLITGSVHKDTFADADFVIEAVFEELSVKKRVFAELEAVVPEDCILATNTSSLSVTAMAADLVHPRRLVGFHFFNPVAAMPLLEIVPAPRTSDETLASAFVLATALQKTPVRVSDSTAFVVNRLLLRLIGEVVAAFDEGTPAEIADNALEPMGLPMTPFDLLAMIGLPVSLHVSKSLHAAFGGRFKISANLQTLVDNGVESLWVKDQAGGRRLPAETMELLQFGDTPSSSEQVLIRVQDALAEEIDLMLTEGVVATAQDIDLCMIGGAGWPLHLGGITPYLDLVGAARRVTGQPFNAAAVPAAELV